MMEDSEPCAICLDTGIDYIGRPCRIHAPKAPEYKLPKIASFMLGPLHGALIPMDDMPMVYRHRIPVLISAAGFSYENYNAVKSANIKVIEHEYQLIGPLHGAKSEHAKNIMFYIWEGELK